MDDGEWACNGSGMDPVAKFASKSRLKQIWHSFCVFTCTRTGVVARVAECIWIGCWYSSSATAAGVTALDLRPVGVPPLLCSAWLLLRPSRWLTALRLTYERQRDRR